MKIGDVAKKTGLPLKTVRYYADIGLVKPETRSDAGYRIYNEANIKKLIFVKRSRGFGFTIEECRELLSLYEDRNRASLDVKRIASKRLAEIEVKQRELQELHRELSYLTQNCKGDDRPDCPILAGLESFTKT